METTEITSRDFWNNFATKYDDFIARYAQKTYNKSLALMKSELNPNDEVLEIGTGSGIIAFEIHKQIKTLEAIDYAEEMIELAKSRQRESGADNIRFRVASAIALPYPDASFPLVIASNILHLLPEADKALWEIHRALKPGGKVLLPTYCHGQNIRSKLISWFMSLSGFKAENKWSANSLSSFVKAQDFSINKEILIQDKIPLSFIVAEKK